MTLGGSYTWTHHMWDMIFICHNHTLVFVFDLLHLLQFLNCWVFFKGVFPSSSLPMPHAAVVLCDWTEGLCLYSLIDSWFNSYFSALIVRRALPSCQAWLARSLSKTPYILVSLPLSLLFVRPTLLFPQCPARDDLLPDCSWSGEKTSWWPDWELLFWIEQLQGFSARPGAFYTKEMCYSEEAGQGAVTLQRTAPELLHMPWGSSLYVNAVPWLWPNSLNNSASTSTAARTHQ